MTYRCAHPYLKVRLSGEVCLHDSIATAVATLPAFASAGFKTDSYGSTAAGCKAFAGAAGSNPDCLLKASI